MGLSITDGRSGRRGPVRPGRRRTVTVYVCGPTVNGPAHVGHARTYLYFDLARRHLEAEGLRVRSVMNITDFEDKISDRAVATGSTWRAVARAAERGVRRDLADAGIRPADVTPRASEHVAEMRTAIRALERRGRTFRREGGLYFRPDPSTDPPHAVGAWALRHAVPEGDHAAPRGAAELEEFGLWLPPHPGGPSWPSPWGPGSPGWHVECFAMARRYLGFPVDLHGGGRDLAYPHHYGESELARTLADRPFAHRYLYAEFVTQAGRKMSKSTGELVPLRTALEAVGRDALRSYLVSRPRNEPLAWDDRALLRTRTALEETRRTFRDLLAPGAGGSVPLAALRALARGVAHDLGNDLRTDRALDRIARCATEVARRPAPRLPRGSAPAGRALLEGIGERLGIDWTGRDRPIRPSDGRRSARARRAD